MQLNYLKTKIGGVLFAGSLLVGLGIATSTMAQAQSPNNRDRQQRDAQQNVQNRAAITARQTAQASRDVQVGAQRNDRQNMQNRAGVYARQIEPTRLNQQVRDQETRNQQVRDQQIRDQQARAQQDEQNRQIAQRDYSRRNQNDRGRYVGGVVYNNANVYGYGSNVYQIAQNQGYQDGLNTGASDANQGQSYNPQRSHYYENANYGYNSSFGNQVAYMQSYRNGFVSGYDVGFRQYAGYSGVSNDAYYQSGNYTSSNTAVAIGNILGAILGRP